MGDTPLLPPAREPTDDDGNDLPRSDVPVVRHRTQSLPIVDAAAAVASPTDPPRSGAAASDVPMVSSEHARRAGGHKTTQMFFLDHREKQGTLSTSRRGLFPVGDFLPVQYATLFAKDERRESKPTSVKPPSEPTYAMLLARAAFLRTANFLDDLLRRVPETYKKDLRASLQKIPGPPRNLPKEDVIRHFEMFGRLMGYYGPVLWFMPPRISLTDLKVAGWLDPTWWWEEPNFIKGLQTLAPYEPEEHEGESEPGFWVLALPGIMPSTANRTYLEQTELRAEVARNVGLQVENGHIDHREKIRAYIGSVADVCVFYAIAQHAKESLSSEVAILRTSTAIRTYQPEEATTRTMGSVRPTFIPSLQERCHVSVAVFPGKPMQLCDYGDGAKGVAMGLTPLFVPFEY